MQKDIHFYATYVLAIKNGIPAPTAEKIAWADQYVDELTKTELYGIQTQSATLGNWADRQIQLSVLIPFHFVPGDDKDRPWIVTADGMRVNQLVSEAIASKCPFQMGIALHALQDSFSHQGFSGWDEVVNACFPWYYLRSGLPNVGHAELGPIPDVVSAVWTDPRTGEKIDNKKRAMEAINATYHCLVGYRRAHHKIPAVLTDEFKLVFGLKGYDDRKEKLRQMLVTHQRVRYSRIKAGYIAEFGVNFIAAAARHLAAAVKSFY